MVHIKNKSDFILGGVLATIGTAMFAFAPVNARNCDSSTQTSPENSSAKIEHVETKTSNTRNEDGFDSSHKQWRRNSKEETETAYVQSCNNKKEPNHGWIGPVVAGSYMMGGSLDIRKGDS